MDNICIYDHICNRHPEPLAHFNASWNLVDMCSKCAKDPRRFVVAICKWAIHESLHPTKSLAAIKCICFTLENCKKWFLDVSRLLRFLSCVHKSFRQFNWLVKEFQRRLWRWLRWLYSFKVPRGKKLLEGTALKSTFFGSLERSDSFFTSSNHKIMTRENEFGFRTSFRQLNQILSLYLSLLLCNCRVTKSFPRKLPKPPRRDDTASVTASCALPSVLEMKLRPTMVWMKISSLKIWKLFKKKKNFSFLMSFL